MVFENALEIVEFSINVGWAVIAIVILFTFLSRFEGKVNYLKPNILGVILMALGLTFHIVGNLTQQLLAGSEIFESGLNHIIASFISLSVMMFILGTANILYHITGENNKNKVKIFGIIYFILGLADTVYHLLFIFINAEDLNFDVNTTELGFVLLEMITLSVIYVMMYVQSNRTVNKVINNRYKLLALTALGFVLVILVDSLIRLDYLSFEQGLTFNIFFLLHVITVGALYLLVLFPAWYQRMVNISAPSS